MTAPNPPARRVPTAAETIAIWLIGAPLLIILVAVLIWDWPRTIALLGALAVYVVIMIAGARIIRLPLVDAPPTPRRYALAAISGAAAGTIYGLILAHHLVPRTIIMGSLYALLCWWFGQFLRAPFGLKPWPPYASPGPPAPQDQSPATRAPRTP